MLLYLAPKDLPGGGKKVGWYKEQRKREGANRVSTCWAIKDGRMVKKRKRKMKELGHWDSQLGLPRELESLQRGDDVRTLFLPRCIVKSVQNITGEQQPDTSRRGFSRV